MSQDAELAADRELLGRTSTVERLAHLLRGRIINGTYHPGDRLTEEPFVTSLEVSRNTLREAFRLLTAKRLLVHNLNRGFFVRKPTVEDVVDVYRVRRLVECTAVPRLTRRPRQADDMAAAIADGERARELGDWRTLGTANMLFHQAVGTLAGSPRIDELMSDILAELRLVFHLMADPRRFHEPYLERNREILAVIDAGDGPAAERLLTKYLNDSEQQLVDAFETTQPAPAAPAR